MGLFCDIDKLFAKSFTKAEIVTSILSFLAKSLTKAEYDHLYFWKPKSKRFHSILALVRLTVVDNDHNSYSNANHNDSSTSDTNDIRNAVCPNATRLLAFLLVN